MGNKLVDKQNVGRFDDGKEVSSLGPPVEADVINEEVPEVKTYNLDRLDELGITIYELVGGLPESFDVDELCFSGLDVVQYLADGGLFMKAHEEGRISVADLDDADILWKIIEGFEERGNDIRSLPGNDWGRDGKAEVIARAPAS